MIRIMMMSLLIAIVATAAQAGTIQARSDQPASVFLDGNYVGRAPVDIPGVRGQHQITFRSRATGQSVTYGVSARGRRSVSRVTANFGFAATPRSYYPRAWGAPRRFYDQDRWDDRNRWDDRYDRSYRRW
jgi:hypothetical protein